METIEIINSWIASKGVIASILPKTIVLISTEVGDNETINRPRPKKELKINPIITSSFSFDRWFRKSMTLEANPPEKKAPSDRGNPSM